jgi:predicted ABC-type ATPase
LGGHDVQDVVIRRRYLRGARNFFRLYRALSDAWVIYDNSNVATPVAIASGSIDGAVIVFDETAWQEFTRLNDETRAPDQ